MTFELELLIHLLPNSYWAPSVCSAGDKCWENKHDLYFYVLLSSSLNISRGIFWEPREKDLVKTSRTSWCPSCLLNEGWEITRRRRGRNHRVEQLGLSGELDAL